MKNNELLAFVSVNGMDLESGKSKRVVCPACNATHEKSFMIRKTDYGQLTGYCFRVSCPISGKVIGQKGVYEFPKEQIDSFKPRFYEGDKVAAPLSLRMWLFQQYNIPLSKTRAEGVGYDRQYNRLVFPVYDSAGNCYGHQTKKMPNSQDNYPKCVTYFERKTTKLHYPRANSWAADIDTVVLVEDILSAIRVSQYVPAVALLGTHLTQSMVNELSFIWDRAIIALDPDATDKALKMATKFGAFFYKGITVRPMQTDPKDVEKDIDLLTQLGEQQWVA